MKFYSDVIKSKSVIFADRLSVLSGGGGGHCSLLLLLAVYYQTLITAEASRPKPRGSDFKENLKVYAL